MEPRIRRLPSNLINQIAAGEVVERPASVVKELAENAIDAGARRVDVEVEGGGFTCLRVVDDGLGMTAPELRLAVERHATSKISRPDDLWTLQTLGFRGEALPSIAAVSRLTLVSRVSESGTGHRLAMDAGLVTSEGPAGAAVGTQVEVRDLFFNTPARRKFQRSESSEASRIHETVLTLALAHPTVHMRLTVAGRTTLDVPPHADMATRVRTALGHRGDDLFEAQGDEPSAHVHAVLTPPARSLPSARGLHILVNRRAVRDRAIAIQVALGFGGLLPHGRYPAGAVHVTVEPSEVDVNVHPQKAEVRFAKADAIHTAVRRVVARAITRAPWLEPTQAPPPQAVFFGPSRAEEAPFELAPPLPWTSTAESPSISFLGSLHYIGQALGTYLVCETANALVLIDQHAAHERVAFERLRREIESGSMASQGLLSPMRIALDPQEAAAAEEGAQLLQHLGFDLAPMDGSHNFVLRAVPALLAQADPEPLLRDVLGDFAEQRFARSADERVDHILATAACHSVVRAGDALTAEEAHALVAALDAIDHHGSCPHGRPVVLRMPASEIERRFGRT